jgi:hypothetical protein
VGRLVVDIRSLKICQIKKIHRNSYLKKECLKTSKSPKFHQNLPPPPPKKIASERGTNKANVKGTNLSIFVFEVVYEV